MDTFMLFSTLTGVRLNEPDFFIDGRQVNPWVLHRTVYLRNGFDSVRLHDHAMSFPPLMRLFPNFHFSGLGDYEWRMAHCRCRNGFPSGLLR